MSGIGFHFQGIACACPTSADDMVLISYSKKGLDEMMSICYQFGLKFRYRYNASKSAVLVINEKSNEFKSTTRKWSLDDSMVADKETYKHLGITLNKYLNRSINVEEWCQKIRSIFLSLVHCGLFGDGLHPLSAKKLL